MTESIEFLSSVEQIMGSQIVTVSADQSVRQLRAAIEQNGGEPVAVVDANDALVGIVTSSDVPENGSGTAGQVASTPRMTAAPHESAFSVVSRMLSRRIDWVPVLANRKLVGSVSRRSVMSTFGEIGYA